METIKKKIFINCEEAAHICDKSQYNEATWWERFRLNLRYAYCHITRSYVKQNKKLSDLVSNEKVTCMNSASKNELKTKFEKELKHK
jgi:hypothetical protein